MMRLSGNPRKDYEKLTAYALTLEDERNRYRTEAVSLRNSYNTCLMEHERMEEEYREEIARKDAIIKELKYGLTHARRSLIMTGPIPDCLLRRQRSAKRRLYRTLAAVPARRRAGSRGIKGTRSTSLKKSR